jgi:DnaJ-class molecular chaperone
MNDSEDRICKNCRGCGWHRSSISGANIKCAKCRGLGIVPSKKSNLSLNNQRNAQDENFWHKIFKSLAKQR